MMVDVCVWKGNELFGYTVAMAVRRGDRTRMRDIARGQRERERD